jgi:hypothetical protein
MRRCAIPRIHTAGGNDSCPSDSPASRRDLEGEDLKAPGRRPAGPAEPGNTARQVAAFRFTSPADAQTPRRHRFDPPPAGKKLESSFFDHPAAFPPGSAVFDHALIMRDIPHDWHEVAAMTLPAA